jgi:hypothetical protein
MYVTVLARVASNSSLSLYGACLLSFFNFALFLLSF